MTTAPKTVALAGSWADTLEDRRAIASELAAAWPSPSTRVAVFADTSSTMRERLWASGATCWPEGAFGRHFLGHEFDHAVVMIGPRFESLLALARSADEGCHVWLQHDVVDSDGSPIDAPDGWLLDVIASARSMIVGSDRLAGRVRQVAPHGPPVLVMPPAHPMVDPIVEPPGRVVGLIGGDESVHQQLADSLSAHVIRLDGSDMTSELSGSRLLSLRAGVEIRATGQGFASTTVTHMMACGVPTVTDLEAHAPFAASSLSTSGLVVLDGGADDLTARIIDHLRPIIEDDREWLAACTAAKVTAAGWTWTDAAQVLEQWLLSVDHLDRSTVRVVGAVPS